MTVALPIVKVKHSTKVPALPSAVDLDTRQRWPLCRVSPTRHSAKWRPLMSAWPVALGKSVMFAECNGHCTRQSMFLGGSQMVTLPSVMAIALGKVTKNSLFYLFFTSHPNKQKIYITNITNITYISSTAHIYHQHHIYITNVTCLTIYHK